MDITWSKYIATFDWSSNKDKKPAAIKDYTLCVSKENDFLSKSDLLVINRTTEDLKIKEKITKTGLYYGIKYIVKLTANGVGEHDTSSESCTKRIVIGKLILNYLI